MKTMPRRPFSSSIPSYNQNAVLQLIVASGIGFVSYHLARIILLIVDAQPETFPTIFTHKAGLPHFDMFAQKFWTVLIYGWVHNGFWELFTNMVWMYCFGSVVQALVGYKQIIPIFIYSMVIGGLFYEFSQLIPGGFFVTRPFLFGAQASIVALAVAALTIAPGYRFYLTPTFSIPLVALACIFFVLIIIGSDLQGPSLFLLTGGALTGYLYIKLLQNGNRPGHWMYAIFEKMDSMATPDEYAARNRKGKRSEVLSKAKQARQDDLQKRIDDILDKINQHGVNSLTQEEKEILLRAGKEDNRR